MPLRLNFYVTDDYTLRFKKLKYKRLKLLYIESKAKAWSFYGGPNGKGGPIKDFGF